jgi:hypothetical protein
MQQWLEYILDTFCIIRIWSILDVITKKFISVVQFLFLRWNHFNGKRRNSVFDSHSTTRKTCVSMSACDTSMEMQSVSDQYNQEKKDNPNT